MNLHLCKFVPSSSSIYVKERKKVCKSFIETIFKHFIVEKVSFQKIVINYEKVSLKKGKGKEKASFQGK